MLSFPHDITILAHSTPITAPSGRQSFMLYSHILLQTQDPRVVHFEPSHSLLAVLQTFSSFHTASRNVRLLKARSYRIDRIVKVVWQFKCSTVAI